jgi:streptomycin 6-kinase
MTDPSSVRITQLMRENAALAALDLPAAFLRHNDEPQWLAALPGKLDQLAQQWSLMLGPHFPGLSYNYVAPATRADGTACVLKVGRRWDGELLTEIEALRLWNGDGAARLLEAEPESGALLIERLQPGTDLAEVAARDDDEATHIAANLLRHLWRPAPPGHKLRTLRSWFGSFDRNREALLRGDRGFPAPLFERADALLAELTASTPVEAILHGDHHHYNILTSLRPGETTPQWRAIDPKGLAGDPTFDICQFLFNPFEFDESPTAINRRLDVFTSELGLNPTRTRQWCFLWAILQASWDFEDNDDAGVQENLARADLFLNA